jgi:DNA (cytosine-5)-methyltransferase 1
MDTFSFIEVCAGAGGLSTGLIRAGGVPLACIDTDKNCCATLRNNHAIYADVVINNSFTDIDLSMHANKCDLLIGGVPCQSFSQAGLRKGLDDPRGDLMRQFAELITIISPKIFIIENVRGLISHNGGETIKEIIAFLNKTGSYTIKYKVLNAFDYNVPQKRERVFIVGTLPDYEFTWPKKSPRTVFLKDVLTNDVPDSLCASYSSEKIELYKSIPQGGCWINLPIDKQKSYLGKSFFSGGGKRGILYRLSMEKPSLTILCTPTQKQTERCHPLFERPLSVRESARVQTFPDSYTFIGSMASQYKQIGNAVPVNLAYALGTSIHSTFFPIP